LISPKLTKRTCVRDQVINNRLTDPVLRESYLNFGHPDGSKHQETQFGIALPKKVVDKWSTAFLLTYLVLLSAVVPGYAAAWWIRSQSKTAHGFHESTACRFFSAVSHQKALKFPEIITLLSTSHEVTSVIESEHLEIQFLSKLLPLIQNRQLHLENIQVPLSTSKLMTVVSSCRSSRVRPCPENLSPSAPSTYQRQNYHHLSSPRRVSVDLCRRSQIQ
jgi:preprotein translocase subunit Sec63